MDKEQQAINLLQLGSRMSLHYYKQPLLICNSDGNVFTGYYGADATDKAVFAHHIQSDVTMDIIRANIDEIKGMLGEVE